MRYHKSGSNTKPVCLSYGCSSLNESLQSPPSRGNAPSATCQPPVLKAEKHLRKLPTLWCSVTVTDNELRYSSTQTQQWTTARPNKGFILEWQNVIDGTMCLAAGHGPTEAKESKGSKI